MKNTTGVAERCVFLALAATMVLSLADCGGKVNEGIQAEGGLASVQTGAAGEKIINIGVTSSLNTLNPLLMDGVEMNKYATDLILLPLMDLDKDMDFEGVLTDFIMVEDDSNFLVYIDDQAVWSDRTSVTTGDMIYTTLRICSPVIRNVAMVYYIFEGVGDDGFVEVGANHVEGTTKVDNKAVRFTTKAPMPLITFKVSYARYPMPLPKHVTENISEEDLILDSWLNRPNVVSGPYKVTELDRDYYVAYEASKDYWKGVPKISRLNIETMEGNQFYAGLKSEEIDVTQSTMSSIPLEGYESVQSLKNANVSFGDPITNQSIFIRISNIPDAEVCQAMLCATDRRQILDQLSKGNREVSEGFLSSTSPYLDESITPVTYDPKKAKTLLEKSGWDKNKTTKSCINSGDGTFVNTASVIAAQWVTAGIKADIQTMDINTLLGNTNKGDFDMMAMQHIYPPMGPYVDAAWLLGGEDSWTEYSNDKVSEALSKVQPLSDIGGLKGLYSIIGKQVREDVPMFSVYIIKTMVTASKRFTGAGPNVHRFLDHVEQWDITQ